MTSRTDAPSASHSPVPYAELKSFLAGAVSGAIAKTAVAPFDRTKILMQVSQMYGWRQYRGGVWHSMCTIWNTEGFFGFFRGNSATVARIMPYSAVQYYAFELYHRTLSEYAFKSDSAEPGKPNPAKRFIAGACAGVTSVLITYPIDLARTVIAVQTGDGSGGGGGGGVQKNVVKTQFATTATATANTSSANNNLNNHPVTHSATANTTTTATTNTNTTTANTRLGVFSTLYKLFREQGISSIYRGMYPTLVGVVPYAGISFLSFGQLKRVSHRYSFSKQYPILTNLVCGASAGLTAQCCTYPFDLVRRRLQALHKPELMTEQERAFLRAATTPNRLVSFSIINAVSFIIRNEGWKGLYRGVSLNFLKTAPAMSISFTCYDKIRIALGVPPGKYSATRG